MNRVTDMNRVQNELRNAQEETIEKWNSLRGMHKGFRRTQATIAAIGSSLTTHVLSR